MALAPIVREIFLEQNCLTSHDCWCPPSKTLAMMKALASLVEGSIRLISESSGAISWDTVWRELEEDVEELWRLKRKSPWGKEEVVAAELEDLAAKL